MHVLSNNWRWKRTQHWRQWERENIPYDTSTCTGSSREHRSHGRTPGGSGQSILLGCHAATTAVVIQQKEREQELISSPHFFVFSLHHVLVFGGDISSSGIVLGQTFCVHTYHASMCMALYWDSPCLIARELDCFLNCNYMVVDSLRIQSRHSDCPC